MRRTFFTGAPGFIGTRLARKLLEESTERSLSLLVYPEPALLEKARALATEEETAGRVEVIPGDIRAPHLGLAKRAYERIADEAEEVFHLAALYDISAPREPSYRVNVSGTRHILDLCERMKQLRRLVYFSTFVVSGDRTGIIYEHELQCGQRFRNWYEETKFLAEVEVRRRSGVIPTIIVRPAITVGDSRSGQIEKYDGPYYLIAALARHERHGALGLRTRLLAAGEAQAPFHVIPVDFLIEATCAIAADPASVGKTFHIMDPQEKSLAEFRSMVLDRFGIDEFPVPVSARLLRSLFLIPGVERLARTPRELLDYMDSEAKYDDANTRAVTAKAGIACPPIASYIDTLVAFVRSHPEIPIRMPR